MGDQYYSRGSGRLRVPPKGFWPEDMVFYPDSGPFITVKLPRPGVVVRWRYDSADEWRLGVIYNVGESSDGYAHIYVEDPVRCSHASRLPYHHTDLIKPGSASDILLVRNMRREHRALRTSKAS